MLVIDASVAFRYAVSVGGYDSLTPHGPIAPPLMWSEALSSLHEAHWRGEASAELTVAAIDRLLVAPIERDVAPDLYAEARRVAMMLGWAKTYDAEYVALARLRDCPLVSVDARLQRGAGHLARIIAPADL